MDQQFLILIFAVVLASALQAATGIGFGVIAGPVMLVVLNDGAAIQISIALSFLIAAVLAPSLWRKTDRRLLTHLVAGSLVGLPIGLVIYMSADVVLLKLLAGLAVSLTFLFVVRSGRPAGAAAPGRRAGGGRLEQLFLGVVSGAMGGSLAMPGPIPAAWMAARAYDKETIRATILTMFILSYLAALALQASLAGIGQETMRQSLILVPPTLVGVAVGRLLTKRLTERVFRWTLILVLAATAIGLFSSSIPHLVTQ